MYEILDHLPDRALVLDIGCGEGSFPAEGYKFRTVRVDLNPPHTGGACFIQADATRLPFRSRSFNAIVLNHSIEHFAVLKPALQEIGRVVKRDGAIFAAVPDARTFTDRLYRKVMRNRGGHVNLFGSRAELEKMLAWYFGLPHVATRTLHSGLTFLNRKILRRDRTIRAQARFGGLSEPLLALVNAGLRLADRSFGMRLSVYGWAMYFGTVPEAVDPDPMINVCVRCGDGRPYIARWYKCPGCGARNIGIRSSPGARPIGEPVQ
jgi:SAM-dependent methyltransferase